MPTPRAGGSDGCAHDEAWDRAAERGGERRIFEKRGEGGDLRDDQRPNRWQKPDRRNQHRQEDDRRQDSGHRYEDRRAVAKKGTVPFYRPAAAGCLIPP